LLSFFTYKSQSSVVEIINTKEMYGFYRVFSFHKVELKIAHREDTRNLLLAKSRR